MYTKSVVKSSDVHHDFYGWLFVTYVLFSWVINKTRISQLQDNMQI